MPAKDTTAWLALRNESGSEHTPKHKV